MVRPWHPPVAMVRLDVYSPLFEPAKANLVAGPNLQKKKAGCPSAKRSDRDGKRRWMATLTGPVIWLCVIPILLADLIGSFYQAVCFPVYGIPKVRRRDYLAFDRHRLGYLNVIEKLNCDYCAYVNGILAYFTEIAARTEQYWCPIKHATCAKCAHSRYRHFIDYGDAEGYRTQFETARRDYGDLAVSPPPGDGEKPQ